MRILINVVVSPSSLYLFPALSSSLSLSRATSQPAHLSHTKNSRPQVRVSPSPPPNKVPAALFANTFRPSILRPSIPYPITPPSAPPSHPSSPPPPPPPHPPHPPSDSFIQPLAQSIEITLAMIVPPPVAVVADATSASSAAKLPGKPRRRPRKPVIEKMSLSRDGGTPDSAMTPVTPTSPFNVDGSDSGKPDRLEKESLKDVARYALTPAEILAAQYAY